jgi:hypothetical protein
MIRGEAKYLVISKQMDQANPLAGAPVSHVYNSIDELQRGLLQFERFDNLEIVEAFPLPARLEKKVVLGRPAANNA